MIFPKESKSLEKLSCFPRDPRLLLWEILARSCRGDVVFTFSSSSSSSLSSLRTELRMSSFMDRFLSTSALLVLMNFIACSSLRHWDLICPEKRKKWNEKEIFKNHRLGGKDGTRGTAWRARVTSEVLRTFVILGKVFNITIKRKNDYLLSTSLKSLYLNLPPR